MKRREHNERDAKKSIHFCLLLQQRNPRRRKKDYNCELTNHLLFCLFYFVNEHALGATLLLNFFPGHPWSADT